MFDIATRPAPAPTSGAFGLPFDWQLAPAAPVQDMPWTDYSHPSGQPQHYADRLAVYALALEPTLQTAIVISLFSDRRAGPDEVLPRGTTDRRGWVGDEFMAPAGAAVDREDQWGSLLWLLYAGKSTTGLLARAEFAAKEALAWMVRDGLASRVDVVASWVPGTSAERLALRVAIHQADSASPVYDVLWATTIARGAA